PDSACPHRRQAEGLQSSEERSFSGGTRGRNALRWPGCPRRFRGDGGLGGFRFRPIGSEDGGLDELVEFWLSLASSSAIRFFRERRLRDHTRILRSCCIRSSGCERARILYSGDMWPRHPEAPKSYPHSR